MNLNPKQYGDYVSVDSEEEVAGAMAQLTKMAVKMNGGSMPKAHCFIIQTKEHILHSYRDKSYGESYKPHIIGLKWFLDKDLEDSADEQITSDPPPAE